jgi:hypothetical protein
LLVRKTGVGLKAAIDESGALTNQVVFHFVEHQGIPVPEFLLDYMLGILCSRVLLAYHLRRSGENEWRSHPYVTPKMLMSLPVPPFKEGTWHWRQARAIADAARARQGADQSSDVMTLDLNVERLVAGMYDISEEQIEWVANVLDEAQALEPIRSLRISDPSLLKAVRVD